MKSHIEMMTVMRPPMDFPCEVITAFSKKAIEKYGEDENVLHYVGQGIRRRGHLTPMDLFYIIVWKAPRETRRQGVAASHAFECIRKRGVWGIAELTWEALLLADNGEIEKSIEILSGLDGVKTRVASSILTFYRPDKFGMVDKLAWESLYTERKEEFEPSDYVEYLKDIRQLAEKCHVTPRIVDVALWYWKQCQTS